MADRMLLANYASFLPGSKEAAILDVGCGHGRVLRFLEGLGFRAFEGVDVDAAVLAALPENLRGRASLVTDITDFLRGRPQAFELIICKDMVYYLTAEQARAFVRAAQASLKPGGLLILGIFNGALLTAPYILAKDHGIRLAYTEQSLRALAESAGLRVETIFGERLEIGGLKFLLFSAARWLWWRVLALIYLLERGRDPENPRRFDKSLILVARRETP